MAAMVSISQLRDEVCCYRPPSTCIQVLRSPSHYIFGRALGPYYQYMPVIYVHVELLMKIVDWTAMGGFDGARSKARALLIG
jgi:hypothetical protein